MPDEAFGPYRLARTEDLDRAQAAMESVFLPLRLRLREPTAPLDMALNARLVGDVTASYVRFGRDLELVTAEAENYHVNIPITGGTDSRSGRLERVQATPQRAAVFMPGLPADIGWRGDCAQFCLMFPRRRLHHELEALLDRPLSRPIEFAPAMDLTTRRGRAWVDTLWLIERESQRPDNLLDYPLAARNLESVLIDGLLLAQPHNYTDEFTGPRRPAPPLAVRQAIELIQANPELPWRTTSLARRVTVSTRSLQEGFARSVGVSPMRYLREVRLDRVHAELRSADPGSVSVSQVAARAGFLHLGRFAAAYWEKFGQRPSETLRTLPRSVHILDRPRPA
jgi:AraC-like DNA-binding protein